ncbi:MAG: PQQ-like beta-propeller repeat protein [Myxococcales bacterium]|nr:PQQ-like beta-propeller repeat protein [Myxococcales bacterium]
MPLQPPSHKPTLGEVLFVAVLVLSLVVLALLDTCGEARADTYMAPNDLAIVALDLDTGKELWRAQPPSLSSPKIYASASRVYVWDGQLPPKGKPRYVLRVRDGKKAGARGGQRVAPLAALPRNLLGPGGWRFQFSDGNTRHLVARKGGVTKTILALDTFPHDLNIAGSLALFTFAGGVGGMDVGGGEVYAWDLQKRRLAWELDASRYLPKLPEGTKTEIGVDAAAKTVLVSVDQTIFALALDSGKLRWMRKLPRQAIRRYDSAWSAFARYKDRYIIRCYEDLFVLRARDGKLLWSFDAGRLVTPWPTISGTRAYVAARRGPVRQLSASFVGRRRAALSALEISVRGSGCVLRVRAMSRRDVPRKATLWWSLRPPPISKAAKQRVLLRGPGGVIDLSLPLRKRGKVYVKMIPLYPARLECDGAPIKYRVPI